MVLSPRSGQLTGTGAEGVYARDRRILSRLEVTVDGREPIRRRSGRRTAAATHRYGAVSKASTPGHDPTVRSTPAAQVDGDGMTEPLTLVNHSHETVDCQLNVALGTDLAGTAAGPQRERRDLPTLEARSDDAGGLYWEKAGTRVTASRLDPALSDDESWQLKVEPGEESTMTLRVTASSRPLIAASRSSRRPSDRTYDGVDHS